MNKMTWKKMMMVLVAVLASATMYGKKVEADTLRIQTSIECGECKERVEKALSYEKGVKWSEVNVETKELRVVINPKKTNIDKVRQAVAEVGYDADDVAKNQKAYEKLPACCKVAGHKE